MVRHVKYDVKMDLNVENVKAGTTIMTFVCYCFPSETPSSTGPVWLQSRAQLPAALPAGWCHRPAGLLRFSALERSLPWPCGLFPPWVRPAHLSVTVKDKNNIVCTYQYSSIFFWFNTTGMIKKMTLQTGRDELIQPQLLKHNHAVDTKMTPASFLGKML